MGAEGFDVHEADVARLSPFVRHHVNMPGRSCFQLPGLPGVCARCASLGGGRASVAGRLAFPKLVTLPSGW